MLVLNLLIYNWSSPFKLKINSHNFSMAEYLCYILLGDVVNDLCLSLCFLSTPKIKQHLDRALALPGMSGTGFLSAHKEPSFGNKGNKSV